MLNIWWLLIRENSNGLALIIYLIFFANCTEPTKNKIAQSNREFIFKNVCKIDCYLLETAIFQDSVLFIYNYDSNRIEKYNYNGELSTYYKLDFKGHIFSLTLFNSQIWCYSQDESKLLAIDTNLIKIREWAMPTIKKQGYVFRPYTYYNSSKIEFLDSNTFVMPTECLGLSDYASKIESRKIKFSFSPIAKYQIESTNANFKGFIGKFPKYFISEYHNFSYPVTSNVIDNKFILSFPDSYSMWHYNSKGELFKKNTLITEEKKFINWLDFDSAQASDYTYLYNYEIQSPSYRNIFLLDSNIICRLHVNGQKLSENGISNQFLNRKFSILMCYSDPIKIEEFMFDGNKYNFLSIYFNQSGFYLLNRKACDTNGFLNYSYFAFQ